MAARRKERVWISETRPDDKLRDMWEAEEDRKSWSERGAKERQRREKTMERAEKEWEGEKEEEKKQLKERGREKMVGGETEKRGEMRKKKKEKMGGGRKEAAKNWWRKKPNTTAYNATSSSSCIIYASSWSTFSIFTRVTFVYQKTMRNRQTDEQTHHLWKCYVLLRKRKKWKKGTRKKSEDNFLGERVRQKDLTKPFLLKGVNARFDTWGGEED